VSGSAALEGARQGLGRGILLGLEFFVAADIITPSPSTFHSTQLPSSPSSS
jgi:uncharacterized membrane protein